MGKRHKQENRGRLFPFLLLPLALFLFLAGCSNTCFVRECDYEEFHRRLNIPAELETHPENVIAQVDASGPEPTTVLDPERPPRFITLQEAIAIALEQGTIGSTNTRAALTAVTGGVNSPVGVSNDDLVGFTGNGVVGSDSIRVLSLNPALVAAGIQGQLARFDTQFTTSMSWTTTDEPVQGLSSLSNGQAGALNATLAKPLPTGGVAGITFTENYRILAKPPGGTFAVLSPSYTSQVALQFEQPLLRGYGVDINQILATFPNSFLFQNVNGRRTAGTEGILITRLRFNQSRAEFERQINFQLLNVESAYWFLYGSYVNLYSKDQLLRLNYAAWKIGKAKVDEGKIAQDEYALTRAKYEDSRAKRLAALGQILEVERVLRQLLGMPAEDGKRLVPADAPTLAPYRPDWQAALEEALTQRPELVLAREDLKIKQFNLLAQQNFLLPDLRFTSSYAITGLGSTLAGDSQFLDSTGTFRPTNSLRALASNHFDDWTVGLTFNMPLGFRLEYSLVRQAKLQLAQAYALLKEQEIKARSFLAKEFSVLQEYHKSIEAYRQARQAYAEEVEVRFRKWAVGKVTIDFLLDAQNDWANALTNEYGAVVNYNVALAGFQFAKGTLQKYDNVAISEGPLPACAQVRAVEHEHDRTQALVLRERAAATSLYPQAKASGLPDLPADHAPTLPALMAPPPAQKANGPEPAPPLAVQGPAPANSATSLPTPAVLPSLMLPPVIETQPQLGAVQEIPDGATGRAAHLGAPVTGDKATR